MVNIYLLTCKTVLENVEFLQLFTHLQNTGDALLDALELITITTLCSHLRPPTCSCTDIHLGGLILRHIKHSPLGSDTFAFLYTH